MTISGKFTKVSNSRRIDGIPATGKRCFGVSEEVMGNKRLPFVPAKITAVKRQWVFKKELSGTAAEATFGFVVEILF